MSATACKNPRCFCDPCTCAECHCGATTLGELERRVIEILWARTGHELTIREVADRLPEYAYTTVATVLDRLVRKELATRRTEGRTVVFTAVGSGAAHVAGAMHDILDSASDSKAALETFASSLSRAEASVLRRALQKGRDS